MIDELESRLTAEASGGSWLVVGVIEQKKQKTKEELMDMDNSVVIVGGREYGVEEDIG